MACNPGVDPADLVVDLFDPGDDVNPPEVNIDDVNVVKDPDGSMWARFPVNVTRIDYANPLSVDWATAGGTAVSTGGNPNFHGYTGQTLIIPAGTGDAVIAVEVFPGSPAFSGVKKFTVILSSPSACTIGDDTGQATIDYTKLASGGGGGGDDPLTLSSYLGWPGSSVVYDQTKDCRDQLSCQAFSAAAALTGLHEIATGTTIRFNAPQLFLDAGAPQCVCSNPATCKGWFIDRVLRRLKTSNGGAHIMHRDVPPGKLCVPKDVDSGTLGISSFSQIYGSTRADLVNKMKQAIYENGLVVGMTALYPRMGSNAAMNKNIIFTDTANTSDSHAWVFVGWNDNKRSDDDGGTTGCFLVHNSWGCNWGVQGRAWMPYSFLRTTWSPPSPRSIIYRLKY